MLIHMPTIESARGVLAMEEILSSTDVAAISWGPYDLAADSGGVFGFEGEMVDGPIIKRARRYLMLAERYNAMPRSGA